MKKLLLTLLTCLVLSSPAFSVGKIQGTLGRNNVDVMCDGKLLNGNGLIILNFEMEAAAGSGTTAEFIDPATGDAPVDYQVPTDTTFLMECIKVVQFGAALAGGSLTFYPGYVDDIIINAATTNPFGAISGAAGSTRLDMIVTGIYHGEGELRKEVAFYGRVPEDKRPAIISLNTSWQGMVRMFGHEIPD